MRWMAGMIFLLPQYELVGGQSRNVSANTCLSLNHLNAALANSIGDLCYMKASGILASGQFNWRLVLYEGYWPASELTLPRLFFCKCIIGIINATGQHQHAGLWDCAPGHCAELEVETEINESKREGETWPCACVTLMLATVQHWPCQFARDSSLTGTQSLINTIQCVYLGHCGVDWKKTINVLFLLGDGLAEKEAERQMFDWEFSESASFVFWKSFKVIGRSSCKVQWNRKKPCFEKSRRIWAVSKRLEAKTINELHLHKYKMSKVWKQVPADNLGS